jgi:hypothetical protein
LDHRVDLHHDRTCAICNQDTPRKYALWYFGLVAALLALFVLAKIAGATIFFTSNFNTALDTGQTGTASTGKLSEVFVAPQNIDLEAVIFSCPGGFCTGAATLSIFDTASPTSTNNTTIIATSTFTYGENSSTSTISTSTAAFYSNVVYQFSPSIQLTSGHTYTAVWKQGGLTDNFIASDPNGVGTHSYDNTDTLIAKQWLMKLYGDPFTTPTDISFIIPTASTTHTDFPNWAVALTGAATTTGRGIWIDYSQSSSLVGVTAPGESFEDQFNNYIFPTDGTFFFPKKKKLILPPQAQPQTWYARALYVDESDPSSPTYLLPLATSSLISFDIVYDIQVDATTCSLPSSTFSGCGTASDFIADPLGTIKNGICTALVCSFVPPQSSWDQFNSLGTLFASKPPFGYFTAIKTDLTALKNGTSSNQLSGFEFLTGVFTPLYTGIIVLLWLLFAFWLLHRIRLFEL